MTSYAAEYREHDLHDAYILRQSRMQPHLLKDDRLLVPGDRANIKVGSILVLSCSTVT